MHEFHAAPNGRYVLQKDPLAGFRRLRAQQACSGFRHLAPTGDIGSTESGGKGDDKNDHRQLPVGKEPDRYTVVHHFVGEPDDGREQYDAYRVSDNAAQDCGSTRIEHESHHNVPSGISESLQNSDLTASLVYHTGHGRHTDKDRDQDEKEREDPGDLLHDFRVALEAGIGDICGPLEKIRVRFLEICQFVFRILELFFCVRYFRIIRLFGVLVFGNAVLVFDESVFIFLKALFIIEQALIVVFLSTLVICCGLLIFCFAVFVVLNALVILLLARNILCKSVIVFLNACLVLFESVIISGEPVIVLRDAVIVLGNACLILFNSRIVGGSSGFVLGSALFIGSSSGFIFGNSLLVSSFSGFVFGKAGLILSESRFIGGFTRFIFCSVGFVFGETCLIGGSTALVLSPVSVKFILRSVKFGLSGQIGFLIYKTHSISHGKFYLLTVKLFLRGIQRSLRLSEPDGGFIEFRFSGRKLCFCIIKSSLSFIEDSFRLG